MTELETLERAFDHTAAIIDAIDPDQLGGPTPCAGWDVRALLEHTIASVTIIGAGMRGNEAGGPPLADDPARQFRAAADAALAAWHDPGALDRVVDVGPGPMPGRKVAAFTVMEVATHAWDIARATGQEPALADDMAELALAVAHQIVRPERRPGMFAEEVRLTGDSTATERLVAFLGRDPGA
ncbi:MAG: TIGR03086 family metal-binding protein [Acidimicrobiales bacterium]